ncbi:hypothetical protein PENSOL_c004G07504 [Penicillium solitum]|uniref:FAD/NAD(P)-binding domain-containing protein n=1 Tax=Penicillium solitum TaxID=60172 RepID=A0A1V6RIY9_9EURO|nr:uncharacterized protein PENSOL_c004G07504 [Penicillium solitum]OQE01566.1 hypothetical protein PENSOL_c004G07504 [Penicillium solitum]
MNFDQKDVPQQTVKIPRGDLSQRHYSKTRKRRVVIVGCSYAGMSATLTLAALKDGLPIPFASYGNYSHLQEAPLAQDFNITIVDERDGFFHSVGAPLAHISPAKTHMMWKLYRGFAELKRPDINFIQGAVTNVISESQTIIYQDLAGNPQTLDYDYIIISSGLRRPWPVVPRSRKMISYLKDASTFAQRIAGAQKLGVVVIGGGVEFAGKIQTHYAGTPVTLIHSRDQLLSNEPLPEEFKLKALELLQQEGVKVILNQRVKVEELPDGTHYVRFNDGGRLHTAMVIMATASSTPASQFLPCSVLSNTGTVNVDSNLRVNAGQDIMARVFAAGDITSLPGIKLGGTAMVMGSVAGANAYASLIAEHNPSWPSAMEPYVQMKPRMALSVGNNAVCYSSSDEGVRFGDELVEPLFGSDLGWSKILTALGLKNYDSAC